MRETTKTNAVRPADFAERYLQGRVIDIGAGSDPVCAGAEGFDLNEGDANEIGRYRAPESYDTVYSSHCLEHMHDPPSALQQWWGLVKPGGYLVLVVPHEDLYEQGFWPSIFNTDHKATFRCTDDAPASPVSYNIHHLVAGLPGCEVISVEVQDQGYDHALRHQGGPDRRRLRRRVKRWRRRFAWLPWVGAPISQGLLRWAVRHGVPVDQSEWDALAQLQAILRKTGPYPDTAG